ncbi:hypothetical protein NM688_g7162 [Phlebia brevispora]|uniref:Uncharacterized protein n=1 Tax=Phlebia brevispora TaxID=194682 RepID=A0ACC1S8H0_9APHY|nr:hypothetical protein NM688_g7162 [Phlebia brevispora]
MVYTFEKAATSIGPNYYELLGVLPTADEAALKSGFRAFAKKYHPDRAGPAAEPLFMEVRDAYEALKDPITRFAYDRFGPSALGWKTCTTMQDYISHGLYQSTAIYIVGVCALLFWNKIAPHNLAFWNYVLLSGTFAYELLYILSPSSTEPSSSSLSSLIFTDPVSPSSSGVLAALWPTRVAYQHISFIKSLSVLLSSALYQVLPNIFPSIPDTLDVQQLYSFFNLVNTFSRNIDAESEDRIAYFWTTTHTLNAVFSMINMELNSFSGSAQESVLPTQPSQPQEEDMAVIDEEIQNILLENALCTQGGPMQSMIQQVQRRRKAFKEAEARASTESRALSPPRHSTPSRRQTGKASVLPGRSLEGYVGYVRGRSRSCET